MKLLQIALAALLASTLNVRAQNTNVWLLQIPISQASAVPALLGGGNTVSYTGGGAAAVIDSNIAVSCVCATLSGATVTITGGAFTGDIVSAALPAGITSVFTSNTLTLSGTSSVANYTQALQSATFASSNGDPTNGGSNPTRTITWQVANGSFLSNQPTSTINVASGLVAPTLTPGGTPATFTSSGSPVQLDPVITLTCSCTTLVSASIDIGAGQLAGDVLVAGTPGSLTQFYDTSAGTLTLTGTATLAIYQTAFRSITYSSSLSDPTNGGANPARVIHWTADNGVSTGTATTTVNVQNPSVPTISVVAGNSVNYTAGGSPLAVNGSLNVSCSCANLTSATLTISSGLFTGDLLSASGAFGITATYSGGVMTLSGTSSVANYQTLLRTIAYSSSNSDPSNGGLNTTRTATWVATNSGFNSAPATTAIDVFIAGQPSWVKTGATAAINPATNQSWVTGLGTSALSAEVITKRTTTETCYGGTAPNYVTFAAPNTACATSLGLAVWAPYTNYVSFSNDASNGAWTQYTVGTGSTIAVTGNSALDPTGITSQAAKVVVTRTSAGSVSAVINNGMTGPASTYSMGVWLQADPSSPGSIGKVIQFAFLSTSGYNVYNITLTANWVWYPFKSVGNPAAGCNGATQSCQFQVGLTNQPGQGGAANSTLTATFDVWGAELNTGTIVYPTYPTTSTPRTTAGDDIEALAGSALETAISGPASSVLMNTNSGVQGQTATLLDSNNVTLLGEATTNKMVTALGIAASSSNAGVWTSPTVDNYARDNTGRSMALNNSIIFKDIQATVVGVPLFLGSTLGTSNFFNGYLGTLNAFNTRVADSLIGVTGVGSSYYFAATGNDSAACTIGAPCLSITKANSISFVTNDILNFNGGDSFTGCLNLTGGTNLNSTRASPITIQSYGTGQATLIPNCTTGSAKIGVINLTSADGVTINNLNLVDDAAGNANRGVSLKNCDFSSAHGTITVQNSHFSGFHDGPASGNDFGGAFFVDVSCNSGLQMIDHLSVINNTANGTSGTTSSDSEFVSDYAYRTCDKQYDTIQGNLVFNMGGISNGVNSREGTGIIVEASCPVGSTTGTPANLTTPGAIVQFNVVHDMAANNGGCGGPVGIWGNSGQGLIIRMNEVYNYHSTGGCDHGAFDLDASTSNDLIERNYSHNNWGPCHIFFGGQTAFGPDTFRWNVCDSDSNGFNNLVMGWESGGHGVAYVYNNVFVQAPSATPSYMINSVGCPLAGSLFANNIMVARATRNQTNFIYLQGSGGVACTVGSGGLTFANNDWWGLAGAPQWWGRNGNTTTTTTYSAFSFNFAETNGHGVDPQFVLPYQNTTCNSTVGSSGPNLVGGGCPAGFKLAGGSAMHAPTGAVLTSQPYNLPAGGTLGAPGGTKDMLITNGQGTLDYFGVALPCPTTGGFPIGASC